jgi:hypothetical protein
LVCGGRWGLTLLELGTNAVPRQDNPVLRAGLQAKRMANVLLYEPR